MCQPLTGPSSTLAFSAFGFLCSPSLGSLLPMQNKIGQRRLSPSVLALSAFLGCSAGGAYQPFRADPAQGGQVDFGTVALGTVATQGITYLNGDTQSPVIITSVQVRYAASGVVPAVLPDGGVSNPASGWADAGSGAFVVDAGVTDGGLGVVPPNSSFSLPISFFATNSGLCGAEVVVSGTFNGQSVRAEPVGLVATVTDGG